MYISAICKQTENNMPGIIRGDSHWLQLDFPVVNLHSLLSWGVQIILPFTGQLDTSASPFVRLSHHRNIKRNKIIFLSSSLLHNTGNSFSNIWRKQQFSLQLTLERWGTHTYKATESINGYFEFSKPWCYTEARFTFIPYVRTSGARCNNHSNVKKQLSVFHISAFQSLILSATLDRAFLVFLHYGLCFPLKKLSVVKLVIKHSPLQVQKHFTV